MRTEVYSWRVSPELKSALERAAQRRKLSVSKVLEDAARQWLKQSASDVAEVEEQRILHEAARQCIGAFSGSDSRRSEDVRQAIRNRLGKRRAR